MTDPPGGDHQLVVYDDPDGFVEAVTGFLREGLARGERLLAVVRGDRFAWLADALGPEAASVAFLDARRVYEPQAAVTAAAFEYLRAEPARRARVVAEQPLAERSPAEVRDYLRLEAAANLVYHDQPVSILCPYDAAALPDEVLAESSRVHPVVRDRAGPRPSASFVEPRAYLSSLRPAPVPDDARSLAVAGPSELAAARAFVTAQATASDLGEEAAVATATAVVEVLTNALVHGRPPVWIHAYREGTALVHHVHDAGPGLRDPLTGWLPPATTASGGRGLWLARQLCDALEVATDATGTHVRVHTVLGRGRSPR